MWIASASSSSRCESVCGRGRAHVTSSPGTCRPHSVRSVPAQRPSRPAPGSGRVGVADRRVAAVVQRVVGQPALADVGPAVLVAPVGERVRLPQLVRLVPAELRRVRAGRRLVAADAGDPAVEAAERPDERLDLGDRQVEVGLALPELLPVGRGELLGARPLEHLDLRVVSPLDLAPELIRLREQVVGVDREDARLRFDREQHVEQHGLFLLEGARERDLAGELAQTESEDLLGAQRLDVRRQMHAGCQGAPPSTCRRASRAVASRAGSLPRAGCCQG